MITEEYRKNMLTMQYHIPKRLNYLAKRYPNITWYDAQQIFEKVVNEVLKEFQVECIIDGELSYGRGLKLVDGMFEKALRDQSAV